MNPAPDERERIRAAMERILNGTPTHSNGALTIVALALEADVPRNALTQRHLDLKNEFYNRVSESAGLLPIEVTLRATIAKLKATIKNKNTELAQLRTDVRVLVRALNQLSVENDQLREALSSQEKSTVVPFARPSTGK
ncbi:hypothetical protein JVX93_23625 [Mycolicibacterium boenickei]|nr:hypothetical protein JVX93_23625 [Mycolicibacterium boenickei]